MAVAIVPIGVQRRMMELGRIRLGDKKGTGRDPRRKLSKFRLTSASRVLLDKASEVYGGQVQTWDDAPDDGWFELYTETDVLDIVLPPVFSDRDGTPTLPYSQAYELWTGGGCVRRCDGITEVLANKPCLCDPEQRECEIRTRLNVMLPKVPGLGVWTLSTKGWNAATMLPATLDLLMHAASERTFIEASLRLEQRTSKKDGQTMKFVVPVIDLPGFKLEDALAPGGAFAAINAPAPAPAEKPALPAAPAPPADNGFDHSQPDFGNPPPLPTLAEPDAGAVTPETDADTLSASPDTEPVGASGSANTDGPLISPAQVKRFHAIRRRVGMDEQAAKELLQRVTGQQSSAGIPLDKYDAVITALEETVTPEFQIPEGARGHD